MSNFLAQIGRKGEPLSPRWIQLEADSCREAVIELVRQNIGQIRSYPAVTAYVFSSGDNTYPNGMPFRVHAFDIVMHLNDSSGIAGGI